MLDELRFRWGVFVHHVIRRRHWPNRDELQRMSTAEFVAWTEEIGLAAQIREALKERGTR